MAEDQSWKIDLIKSYESSLAFFSNKGKFEREKWVVKRLLSAFEYPFTEEDLFSSQEPSDVNFKEMNFQVKEILGTRRRTDEIKEKLQKVKLAKSRKDLLESYTPTDISFQEIVKQCQNYAFDLISKNKYGVREVKSIDLLIYHNLIDHHVVQPINFEIFQNEFRSLSVVSNQYCSIIYASYEAPSFFKNKEGYAVKFFEP